MASAFQSAEFLNDVQLLTDPALSGLKFDANYDIKTCPPFTGLINQGGTCYLNSLLQALYACGPFRRAVLSWRPSDAVDAGVPTALQRLYSGLALSSAGALSTLPLTASFGWTAADVMQQHDVHEAMTVLLAALASRDGHLARTLQDAFVGKLTDTLTCQVCGACRSRTDDFSDWELAIPKSASKEGPTVSILDCVRAFFEPEVLGEDNAVFCATCNAKTTFTKQFACDRLPPFLMLHLKRFQFDMLTCKMSKVTDPIAIPWTLSSDEISTESDSPRSYSLKAVLMHSGSGGSGHYYCYIKDYISSDADTWLLFNDSGVSRLTANEVREALDPTAKDNPPEETTKDGAAARPGKKPKSGTPYLVLYGADATNTTLEALAEEALLIPADIRAEITQENETRVLAASRHAAQKRVVKVQLFTPKTVPADRVSGLAELESVPRTYWAPRSCTVKEWVDYAFEQWSEANADTAATCGRMNVRLRKVDMQARMMLDIYGGEIDGLSCNMLEVGDSLTCALEARASVKLEWPVYDPNAILLRVYRWCPMLASYFDYLQLAAAAAMEQAEAPEFSVTLPEPIEVQIPGALVPSYTVDDLAVALAVGAIGIPAFLQRACVIPGGLPDTCSCRVFGTAPVALWTLPACTLMRKDVRCSTGDVIIVGMEGADPSDFFDKIKKACTSESITVTANVLFQDGVELPRPHTSHAPELLELDEATRAAVIASMAEDGPATEDAGDHIVAVSASRLESLAVLKRRLVDAVNNYVSQQFPDREDIPKISAEQVSVSRGPKLSMFRDESLRLHDLDIGDRSNLHLALGAPLGKNELIVHPVFAVPLEDGAKKLLATFRQPAVRIPIDARLSALKKQLLPVLKSAVEKLCLRAGSDSVVDPGSLSAAHIRVRVKTSGTTLPLSALPERSLSVNHGMWGLPQRDEVSMRSCLSSLLKAASAYASDTQSSGALSLDRAEIFFELLPSPETLTAETVIVRAREFKAVGKGGQAQLMPLTEHHCSRGTSVKQIVAMLAPGAEVIRAAKPPSYGGPLTAIAAAKLKWERLDVDSDVAIAEPPLSLKESGTLLWRIDVEGDSAASGGPKVVASKPWMARGGKPAFSSASDTLMAAPRREAAFQFK